MTMTLQFLGATEEVTGSCHLLTLDQHQILLDCGLIQGSKADAMRNYQDFPFDPSSIDAVILSHAHIDHSGRIPQLVKAGFTGPIYTHKASAELCEIMLKDTAMLQARDTQRLNKKRIRNNLPELEALFDDQDVAQTVKQFVPLNYGEKVALFPQLSVRLSDAGHILGSAIVELWLSEIGTRKKLVFSGDLGREGMPILNDPVAIEQADLVLMESTYGNRFHRSWDDTISELEQIFSAAISGSQGNILLPAFSVGRAQELLYLFHLYAKQWDLSRWKICLDSPMAIEATKVYINNYPVMDDDFKRFTRQHPGEHPLLSNVEFIQSTEQSMELNEVSKGLIIIAGSGMCNGGRIRCHLEHNLWRSECDVIICGYQAISTPGRMLVDGADHLTIRGKPVKVAAKLHTVGGLSAHADQAELISWYQQFVDSPPLILVHGETSAQQGLIDAIRESPACQPQALVAAKRGDKLDLGALPELVWLP
ncbi:MBL fold metallo-hydrolase RNA specificity domain-containing protein [Agarivorans sp. Toyoura001]|uniref:MBL fold metallo-hydrolase RNA specificity domain-containing protein n=1 Tax=unclassified Agarivorans TaxID=2636026 RepID=UPI0010F1DCD5|nr:MBL fold metallo-hydrolase [Agarivorans sp. Toyoura001]GDY27000.1 MBL fold hydrolase [Agarivorans sp. Toyoura001]